MGALALIAALPAFYACGRYLPRLAAAALALLCAGVATAIDPANIVPFLLATAIPCAAGAAVRSRHELLDALGRRTKELEDERENLTKLSAERERARIARELHDIVAHHLAVIVVQAGAGRMAGGGDADDAKRFTRIRQAGEQALSEMDRLVDLLQENGGEERRIADLIDQAEAAGLTLDAPELPALKLSPEAEQLAYRVVQEGLTNAMKHAPGSEVTLRISPTPSGIEIELSNHGGNAPSSLAETGSGLGLRGLRERIDALGGDFEAAPQQGGFRLRAAIPLA